MLDASLRWQAKGGVIGVSDTRIEAIACIVLISRSPKASDRGHPPLTFQPGTSVSPHPNYCFA